MKAPALFLIAAIVFTAFVAVILASGAGWNPLGQRWNFTNSGQFGDSFGFISSFMAAAAAFAAWRAFALQREEIERLKRSAAAKDRLENKRDFEQTFFNLLRLFSEVRAEIDVIDWSDERRRGRDALAHLLIEVQTASQLKRGEDPATADQAAFREIYVRYRDDLAHYFRLFYHLVKFVDEEKLDDKRLYFRLIRGTLSDTEMVLIALDAMYGGGRKKLKALVDRHGLLHNISEPAKRQWRMAEAFDDSAFGDRTGSASAEM